MAWKNRTVLITGATHFIAAHLAEELISTGSSVKAFIRYDYHNDRGSLDKLPLYVRNRIEVISGSLTNPDAINYAIENADVVFHFGVMDMIPSSTSARDYLENTVLGTFNVLEAARQHHIQKFIHISTAEVYGKVKTVPINEECVFKAQSLHISSDIGAEKLVEGYYLSHGLPVVIARLFNTYGPIQARDAVIPTIIAQAIVGTNLLLGDMNTVRDFVYVQDIVNGLIKMAEIPEAIGEAINLGSGQGISIGDLAEKIVNLIGKDVEILFDATRIRLQNPHIGQLVADVKKASELLGWQPETSLDTGLERTTEWFSERVGT